MFGEGDTVADIVDSQLFGEQQIRVVGYPSEKEDIKEAYLLKLDGEHFSNVYTFEEASLDMETAYQTESGKLAVNKEEKKVYFEGEVTGIELRKYLHSQSQDLFNIDKDWHGDGLIAMSIYDVKDKDLELIQSDTVLDEKYSVGMRVLVGTNEDHGLYILTKNK